MFKNAVVPRLTSLVSDTHPCPACKVYPYAAQVKPRVRAAAVVVVPGSASVLVRLIAWPETSERVAE